MIVTLVLSFAVLTFENAGASVWKDNKDCHLCGIVHNSFGEDGGMVDSEIVVNGTAIKDPGNKYPWIVAIYRKGKFLCTGALITSRYILTAAHCLTKGDTSDTKPMEPDNLTVELAFDDKSGEKVYVSKLIIYPDFVLLKKEFQHDFGLLKLRRKYECSKRAYPICIPKEDMERMGKKLRIAGFGHDKNKDRRKPITDATLRKGAIEQVGSKVCKRSGPNTGPSKSILCGVSKRTKQISCEGDSGSPIFWKFDKVYYVLGVTSSISGNGHCISDAKSTFSKVYYYKKWLEENVGKFPKPYHI